MYKIYNNMLPRSSLTFIRMSILFYYVTSYLTNFILQLWHMLVSVSTNFLTSVTSLPIYLSTLLQSTTAMIICLVVPIVRTMLCGIYFWRSAWSYRKNWYVLVHALVLTIAWFTWQEQLGQGSNTSHVFYYEIRNVLSI